MLSRRCNRSLLALGVTFSLLLVGCGPKGEPATDTDLGASAASGASTPFGEIDACGGLTADIVTRLVGESVSIREDGGTELPSCDFVSSAGEPGSLIQVLALPVGGPGGFTDFDQVIDTQRVGEGDLEVEDVELAGADQAALIDDDGYGLASTTLVAIADDVAYTVYAVGVTRDEQVRIAVGALSAVLTGDLPDNAAIELDTGDVCSLMADDELSTKIGTRVESTTSSAAGSPVCTWEGKDISLLVVDLGTTSRIETLAGVGSDDDANVVTPVEVREGGEAYISETEFGASGFVAVDHRLYSLDAGLGDDNEEVRLLREAVILLAGGP